MSQIAPGSDAETPVVAPPPVDMRMTDQDVVDDHTLRRERLRGSLVRGRDWRRRPEVRMHRRLLASVFLAVAIVGIVMAVAFIERVLTEQKAASQSSNPTHAVSSATRSASHTPHSSPSR